MVASPQVSVVREVIVRVDRALFLGAVIELEMTRCAVWISVVDLIGCRRKTMRIIAGYYSLRGHSAADMRRLLLNLKRLQVA